MSYLVSLPGVGPKTARCVLMYSLGRYVLPVDTHVWRVSERLGWVAGGKHPDERRSAELEGKIDPSLRDQLHVPASPSCLTAERRAACTHGASAAFSSRCARNGLGPRVAEPKHRCVAQPRPWVRRVLARQLHELPGHSAYPFGRRSRGAIRRKQTRRPSGCDAFRAAAQRSHGTQPRPRATETALPEPGAESRLRPPQMFTSSGKV